MLTTAAQPKPESNAGPQPPYAAIEDFTRDAVREVFDKMLGMEMAETAPADPAVEPGDQVIGSVGFVGAANGVIHLQSGVRLARAMTAKLLGLEEAEIESDMISDAIGELTNMVAGAVKSRLCDAGWRCVLTIPSITRGSGLRIETIATAKRGLLPYYSGGCRLLFEIVVKDAQE